MGEFMHDGINQRGISEHMTSTHIDQANFYPAIIETDAISVTRIRSIGVEFIGREFEMLGNTGGIGSQAINQPAVFFDMQPGLFLLGPSKRQRQL